MGKDAVNVSFSDTFKKEALLFYYSQKLSACEVCDILKISYYELQDWDYRWRAKGHFGDREKEAIHPRVGLSDSYQKELKKTK